MLVPIIAMASLQRPNGARSKSVALLRELCQYLVSVFKVSRCGVWQWLSPHAGPACDLDVQKQHFNSIVLLVTQIFV